MAGIARALNGIGLVYASQHDFHRVLDYLEKSLKIRRELNDKHGLAISLANTSTIYSELGDTAKAFSMLREALVLHKALGHKEGIANVLNSMGNYYKSYKMYNKALDCFEQSLDIFQKAGLVRYYTVLNSNIAFVHGAQKNYDVALTYALRSLEQSKELGTTREIRHAAGVLRAIYKAKGDYTNALKMFELFSVMGDSIYNEETRRIGVGQQFKYEYEKKAAADSIRTLKDKAVKEAQILEGIEKLKKEQTQRLALFGGLVFILCLSGFIYSRFRLTQKQKALIELKEQETQRQKILIEEQKNIVEEKQREVLDSIRYAKRIQTALVTSEKYISKNLGRLTNKN